MPFLHCLLASSVIFKKASTLRFFMWELFFSSEAFRIYSLSLVFGHFTMIYLRVGILLSYFFIIMFLYWFLEFLSFTF